MSFRTQIRGIISAMTRRSRPILMEAPRVTPLSPDFGYTRGTPIDRVLIRRYFASVPTSMVDTVYEVGESQFSPILFPHSISRVVHVNPENERDLRVDFLHVAKDQIGLCEALICTQVLNFIKEPLEALKGISSLLRPGGRCYMTVAGLAQVSRYDSARWGDYFRFMPQGFDYLLSQCDSIKVMHRKDLGNLFCAKCLLDGVVAEDVVERSLMDVDDPLYPVVLGAVLERK